MPAWYLLYTMVTQPSHCRACFPFPLPCLPVIPSYLPIPHSTRAQPPSQLIPHALHPQLFKPPQPPHSSAPKTRSTTSTASPAPASQDASSPRANTASHADSNTPSSGSRVESAAWAPAPAGAASCAMMRVRSRGVLLGRWAPALRE